MNGTFRGTLLPLTTIGHYVPLPHRKNRGQNVLCEVQSELHIRKVGIGSGHVLFLNFKKFISIRIVDLKSKNSKRKARHKSTWHSTGHILSE